jgi:serpin B
MKTTQRILIAAALLTVTGLPAGAEEALKSKDAGELAASNNAFALTLYGQLAGAEGNLFFSPSSIHTALSMTYAGAREKTAQQMSSVLVLPKTKVRPATDLMVDEKGREFDSGSIDPWFPERTHWAYKSLLDQLKPGKDAGYQLQVANALWGQKGYPWLPEFLKVTKDNYGAGLREVDFAADTEAARGTINQWVEQQTKEKIKDLIAPGVLNAMTRLVLTNAIYFKGNWQTQFDKKATKDAPFKLSPGRTVDVPMMYQKARFGYGEDGDLQVLSMPYKGKELSMVVLLPKSVDGLAALDKSLLVPNSGPKLAGWLGKLRRQEVLVYLPRFKTTSEFSLADVLKAIGMKDAFVPDVADFSGMNGKRDLFISAVVHKAFVDVNEEGTEAAAATAVVVGLTSARMDEPPVFRADHPFLFLIRHEKTGAILFMGRVMNPKV